MPASACPDLLSSQPANRRFPVLAVGDANGTALKPLRLKVLGLGEGVHELDGQVEDV